MILKHPARREVLLEANQLVTESGKTESPSRYDDGQEAQPDAGVADRVEVRTVYGVLALARDGPGETAPDEKWLRHPAEATFDRDFLSSEADQAGGIDQSRCRIVGEAHKCASERQAARTWIQEIELDGNLQ